MSETSLISLRGLVYFLDQNREWQAQGDGYSQVSLYHDTARDSYRVVAMSLKTKEASINSRVFKEMVLKKDNDTFYQWADAKNRYGINFAEEDKAAEFEKLFREVLDKLSAAPAPAQPATPSVASPLGTPKRAPSFGGGGAPPSGAPTGGAGSTIRATVPPQFNPTGRGQRPQGTPSRVVAPPRPFQRPQPPGRTPSNSNLNQSGGAPTLATPPAQPQPTLQRHNSQSPVQAPPPEEASPPPAAADPPASPTTTQHSTPPPAIEHVEEPKSPKPGPTSGGSGIVSPRGPASRPLGSSNPSTTPTTNTTATTPRAFQPAQVSGGATTRRGTPPLNASRDLRAGSETGGKDDDKPEPVISQVSTMDLKEEEEGTPQRSAEVDTILSPKGEIALRRKQIIDMNPTLSSSVTLILTMMKDASSLFDTRTDQVSAEVKCMIEFLEAHALETKEIFAYRVISKHLLAPLLKSMRRKGAPHLPTDTDPHLVAEMLKISYEELPRRPFHFEHYEPENSFNDLKDHASRVAFIKKALGTVGDAEKQQLGALINLLVKTSSKSSVNGMDAETLAALFAPFVVDGKWLNHKIPPAVKLKKPFKI